MGSESTWARGSHFLTPYTALLQAANNVSTLQSWLRFLKNSNLQMKSTILFRSSGFLRKKWPLCKSFTLPTLALLDSCLGWCSMRQELSPLITFNQECLLWIMGRCFGPRWLWAECGRKSIQTCILSLEIGLMRCFGKEWFVMFEKYSLMKHQWRSELLRT